MKRILFAILLAVVGVTSAKAQGANRIVSLAPSLTKNVYYLESQSKLVGCTSYCQVAITDGKEVVATAVKVNIEKVISLRPDLVIATTITNPETIAMLKKYGVRVEVFPTAKSFDEICQQFLRLGKIIGANDAAKRVVDTATNRVKEIVAMHEGKAAPRIFFQIGAKPLFTVIPNTFMNDYITLAGGVNVVTETKRGTISREAVIALNPDIIFVVTMGIVGDEEKKVWEGYTTLNASKNKQIYIIDSDKASTPTPVSFVETLETIVGLIK